MIVRKNRLRWWGCGIVAGVLVCGCSLWELLGEFAVASVLALIVVVAVLLWLVFNTAIDRVARLWGAE